MTGSRRGREPSAEDLAVWEQVAESVRPLRRRPRPGTPAKPAATPPAVSAPTTKKAPATVPAAAPKPTPPPAGAGVLDRKTRARVARGRLAIEARLDLHGLTQAAAHQRLRRFVEDLQAEGAKIALVITGKGGPGLSSVDGERGILRRSVPAWLASAEFRPFVIGSEPAGRRHGGDGALYVRIRSRKASR